MNFVYIIGDLRFADILDILFLSILSYHLYIWFKGTKAYRALIGLLILGIAFTLARTWGLFLTTWVFQVFWQVLIILLIILFQSEIRQVLERFNPLQAVSLRKTSLPEKWVPGFSEGVFRLARRVIGALIVIERQDMVEEFITEGQYLEGNPSPELLLSIFHKESPLHDGAVLIRKGHIAQAACYLPLSPEEDLPKEWGTRHRAALGLSERCDALVIVVSEERGEVSVAKNRNIERIENSSQLTEIVSEAIKPYSPEQVSWRERTQRFFIRRWKVKLGVLFLVSIFWLLLAGQQNFEVSFNVPVEVKNLSSGLQIIEPLSTRINIKVRGLRKDASILSEKNVLVQLDLSSARPGKKVFAIGREHIRLTNESLSVVSIEPRQIEFTFQ